MKILVILGSPRKNGNSETVARLVADQLQQNLSASVDVIRLARHKIAPCIACGGCAKTGLCVIEDDMGELYPVIDTADIILLASPTYFYGLSAQAKGFIDRIQARWSRKYLLGIRMREQDRRRGYLICTAATQGKRLFDGSILVAKSFFDAIDVGYGGELLVRGVDEKGAVQTHPDELQRAGDFAQKITEDFRS
ncbi:MAG: flavodoxin family protein [Desulfofustis sp.]|jgi:multimeric flavodoxin WrbA|nr:flavodoxin family protein [Desulfofustis sp.]